MSRYRNHVLAIASVSLGLVVLGLLVPVSARAAALTQVNRSDWAGSVKLPSYVGMYIYVPDKPATKPPIMVSAHACGSTAMGQMDNIKKIKAAADANGFILILPDNPGQNCWDVGTTASLKHDGGGDTQAIAQMVKYALNKYNGDPGRVYAMGGSSGGMLTQALMAVYPDVFRAGHARAGVPAGCWADGYASSNQWSDNCAGGNTTKTAQQWGDLVRGMYPGYTGHRPRLQTMQGASDPTISYKNTAESIKEWTNVLGLSTTPTSMDTGYKAQIATYNRQFWKNPCGYTVFEAWSSPGGNHSMPYEETDILKYFGLDVAGGADPEPDCNGTGGTGGAGGGARGSGGTTGTSGTGGARDGGSDVGASGSAGGSGSAGTIGTAGTTGGGGTSSYAGTTGSGETVGIGGTVGSGGTAAPGGSGRGGASQPQGSAGSAANGGSTGAGGSTGIADDPAGCACAISSPTDRAVFQATPLLLAALGLIPRRRHRRARR